MSLFLARRLGSVVLTLFIASFLVFVVAEFSPGNVARKSLGIFATEEQVEILADKLRLGDPLLTRYGRWLGVLLGLIEDPLGDPALKLGFDDPRGHRYFGNLGYSILYKVPVNDILWAKLGNTALLAATAFALIVPISLLLGVLAGMREGSRLDLSLSIGSVVLTSVPEFASAVFLIAIFVVGLGWLPGASPLLEAGNWSIAAQFILPALVLVLADVGYVTRIVRTAMANVMTRPFIRTAVLKGLPKWRVVLRHGLRNAMIVPFTVLMMQINWLVTGVVVTEVVFAYPGFGKMLLEAALFGDIAMIEAATIVALLVAAATQIISDLGYAMLDPRLRR